MHEPGRGVCYHSQWVGGFIMLGGVCDTDLEKFVNGVCREVAGARIVQLNEL
jgi:hypothetical protein